MLNDSDTIQDYKNFVHEQNVDNARVFSIVTSIVCLLLLIWNTGPITAIKYNYILNYTNISALFFLIFLSLWAGFKLEINKKKSERFLIRTIIGAAFLFSSTLGYMDVVQGSGPTAMAVGSLLIAIFFSTGLYALTSLILLNGVIFLILISTIDNIEIMQYAIGIIAVILFSIVAFIKTEKQRKVIFDSTKKLDEKIIDLNKALDVKASFLGHMSHELRTPLNAIIGFSEMLRNTAYLPEKRSKIVEYAEFINSGGNHLLALVNDMLDHNKITTGEMKLSYETVDVIKLFNSYVEELLPLSNNRGQTIQILTDLTSLEIQSDKRIFKQIFYNILSNAQKYSHQDTIIEVTVKEPDPDNIELIVQDQGKGMSPELISQIEKSASSSEAHYIANAEGTGLGLIIVYQLTKLLNGKIKFTSELNSGTKVKLTFPRQRP